METIKNFAAQHDADEGQIVLLDFTLRSKLQPLVVKLNNIDGDLAVNAPHKKTKTKRHHNFKPLPRHTRNRLSSFTQVLGQTCLTSDTTSQGSLNEGPHGPPTPVWYTLYSTARQHIGTVKTP